jgi:hypothetical protein
MKATELLLLVEYRQDITARNYGNKLIDRMRADHGLSSSFANKSEQEVAALKERFIADPAVQNYILNKFEAADPTPNKQYTEWIVRRYIRGDYLLEDLEVVHRYLEKFIEAYRVIKQKNLSVDLNQYTLGTLKELIRSIYAVDATDNKQSEGLYPILPDTKVLYNGPEGQFVIPLKLSSSQALQKIGNAAEWCTADSRAPTYFPSYNARGPLYIWIDASGKKYQFHFGSEQFMDQYDNPLQAHHLKYFFADNKITAPTLMQALEKYMIEDKKRFFFYRFPIEILPPKLMLEAVKQDGSLLHRIPFRMRTRELCETAINSHTGVNVLKSVPAKFKTEELCLASLKRDSGAGDGDGINAVPKQFLTPQFIQKALTVNKYIVRARPDLFTPEILMKMIKRSPNNLRYIPPYLRTKDLCLLAINKNMNLFPYIPYDLTGDEEIALRGIEDHAGNIRFITPENRTKKICLAALQKDPSLYMYVPKKYHKNPDIINAVGPEAIAYWANLRRRWQL